MTYARNKTRITTWGGLFDPCQDNTQMGVLWQATFDTTAGKSSWSIVSAPGGVGGYAHKLDTEVGALQTEMLCHITPFPNAGYGTVCQENVYGTVPIYSSLRWKLKAEFRLRIESDDVGGTDAEVSHSAGFCLDGAYSNAYKRICVNLNVAGDKAGITTFDSAGAPDDPIKTIYYTTWDGSYDTWYDVEIDWSYDYYIDPDGVTVTLIVNGSQVFSTTVDIENWRHIASSTATGYPGQNAFLGRPGIGCTGFDSGGGTSGTKITGYYKDIIITIEDVNVIEWDFANKIMQESMNVDARFLFINEIPDQIGKGTDVQIWLRDSTSDDWVGHFRGLTRNPERVRNRLMLVEAEGYASVLLSEKQENTSYTTQTTGAIVQDILRGTIYDDRRGYFDVSTYFDSTSSTYSRSYQQVANLDILAEMSAIEGFILFLDVANAWHFQSPRTNQLDKHLIWGSSRIRDYNKKDVFLRRPNLIRVIGTGVYSTVHLPEEGYSSGNTPKIRTFHRLDLTTQSDVDDAADLYAALYRDPIQVLDIEMRADYELQIGYIITVTIAPLDIQSQKYLITGIKCDNRRVMRLQLIGISPQISLILAELGKRTEEQETDMVAVDTEADNPLFNVEGLAIMLIHAVYEIHDGASTTWRSGECIITDDFIDDLIDVWENTSVTEPGYIATGTGTTSPTYEDTALGSESDRAAATGSEQEVIADYSGVSANTYYRAARFRRIISGVSAITEIGLFNDASVGTMACRATFSALTEAGSVYVDITIYVDPKPGVCYMSIDGSHQTIDWLVNGNWDNITHVCLVASAMVARPSPFVTYLGSRITSAPFYGPTVGNVDSFTITKYKSLDRIKYTTVYSAYSSSEGSGNSGAAEWGIALRRTYDTDENGYPIVAFRSTGRQATFYNGYDCRWTLWLEIKRGELL